MRFQHTHPPARTGKPGAGNGRECPNMKRQFGRWPGPVNLGLAGGNLSSIGGGTMILRLGIFQHIWQIINNSAQQFGIQ